MTTPKIDSTNTTTLVTLPFKRRQDQFSPEFVNLIPFLKIFSYMSDFECHSKLRVSKNWGDCVIAVLKIRHLTKIFLFRQTCLSIPEFPQFKSEALKQTINKVTSTIRNGNLTSIKNTSLEVVAELSTLLTSHFSQDELENIHSKLTFAPSFFEDVVFLTKEQMKFDNSMRKVRDEDESTDLKYNYYKTLACYGKKFTNQQTINAISDAADNLPNANTCLENSFGEIGSIKFEAFNCITKLYAKKGEIQKIIDHMEKVETFCKRFSLTSKLVLKPIAQAALGILPDQYKSYVSTDPIKDVLLEDSVYKLGLKLLELDLINESIEFTRGLSTENIHTFNRSLCRKYTETNKFKLAMQVANKLPKEHSPQNYLLEICRKECNSNNQTVNISLIIDAINSIKKIDSKVETDEKINQLVKDLVYMSKFKSANAVAELFYNPDIQNRAKLFISNSASSRVKRTTAPLFNHQNEVNPFNNLSANYPQNFNGNYSVNNLTRRNQPAVSHLPAPANYRPPYYGIYLNGSLHLPNQPAPVSYQPNFNGNYSVNNLNGYPNRMK